MKPHRLLVSVPFALLLVALPAAAQEKSSAAASPIATVNGKATMQSQLDMLVRERVAQGQQDSPELRNFLKQELINREVILQESLKRGLDKNPETVMQLEMVRQGVLDDD